ncbi:MAG: AEC family transporter [Lachnospira sp.]
MTSIIATSSIYLFAMLLAFVLKKVGLFHKEDKKILSNLIFYVTLPASLISGFTGAQVNVYYIVSILIGFGVNTVMVIAGQIASARKGRRMQAIYAVNASGFNMACIAIPFLSNFYYDGVPYLCMFDVGDSFYTLGTTYALAQMRMSQEKNAKNSKEKELNKSDIHILTVFKSLFTSVPFDVYFIMTVLSFLNYKLPDIVIQAADFCGHGNGFLAMMMIGISFELNMSKETFGEVIHLLLLRYGIGIISAVFIFCILPAPLIMRQILCAAVFSSSAAVSIIYSEKLGVSTDIAAALNPLSTVLMIPVMAMVVVVTM